MNTTGSWDAGAGDDWMTDLSQQTDQLVKALTVLHQDNVATYITLCITATISLAIFLVVCFKKR